MNNIQFKKNARVVHYDGTFESVLPQYDIPLPPRAVPSSHVLRWGRKSDGGSPPCFAVKFEVGEGYCFGDWSRDLKMFAYPNREYTQAELLQRKIETKKAIAKADKEQKEKHQKAEVVANQVWDDSVPVAGDKHAYLQRKQVKSFGLRTILVSKLESAGVYVRGENYKKFLKGEESLLVMPLQDTDGTIHSVQFINSKDSSDEQSNKMLLGGGKKSGNYFPIGTPPEADGHILLCEGYSTGASLHEPTGQHTIVCIDAGNLLAVAQAIRAKYPKAKMIMCADYDGHKHKDDPSKINLGLDKAIEASQAVGAYVFHPVFSEASIKDPSLKPPSDFNDLHCREGIDAVPLRSRSMNAYRSSQKVRVERIYSLPWWLNRVKLHRLKTSGEI